MSQSKDDLLIAVAYWGRDSIEKTGLEHADVAESTKMRVICDLMSGSCNPDPIQRLLEQDISVMTLAGMHAKVWIADDSVVIGSANVSANGMGFDDARSLEENREAAVYIHDRKFANSARIWFNGLWKESDKVDSRSIELATHLWTTRLTNRVVDRIQTQVEQADQNEGQVQNQLVEDELESIVGNDDSLAVTFGHYIEIRDQSSYKNDSELLARIAKRMGRSPSAPYWRVLYIRVLLGEEVGKGTKTISNRRNVEKFVGEFMSRNHDRIGMDVEKLIERRMLVLDSFTKSKSRK